MRRQTQQERWLTMSLPERQKQYRTSAIAMTLLLTIYLGLAVYAARGYVPWSRIARQYHATQSQAHTVPLVVVSQDEHRHSKGRNDYQLGLREPGGKVRTISVISRDLWYAVNVGGTVTAQIWHDDVRQVQANGISSPTSANPDYRAAGAGRAAATLGIMWLILASTGIWSLSRMKRRMTQVPLPSVERIL